MDFTPLPIDAALPELTAALRANTTAVLVAPPGAGKTTRVPLVLANEDWAKGRRILVLEARGGPGAAASWGWSGGGSRRAPRQRAWRRRSASRSAARSACGCGSTRR